jgi:hypothetical protein
MNDSPVGVLSVFPGIQAALVRAKRVARAIKKFIVVLSAC